MRSLLPLRSLTIKLGIVLFGMVFFSLGVLEFVVVPRLESRLVDARINRLEEAVLPLQENIPAWPPFGYTANAAVAASRYETRVVILTRLSRDSLSKYADSSNTKTDLASDGTALRAAKTNRLAEGRVERGGRSYAEVAFPVGEDSVVLLTAPLSDVLESFDLMRRSLLVAGAIALLAAAVIAYAAAWGLTRRLRRLETAAERIAGGDFSRPVVDRGRDEVAQLAAAFENMRERLSHLERARREFIQNASHELRTPLFSVGGFLELLADEDLDDETRREFLAETRAQIDRLARLATDLLDLSRLDAGQLEVTVEDVGLPHVARTVCEEFRPASDDHPLDVRVDEDIVALADEQRVFQIARILVQNAIRHTPAGTPVEIVVRSENDMAVLAVRDEGPGIPADALPHVFERFYRASGGRTSGSGLGLAIGSELARMMSGSLDVTSAPGETVFRLTLPASQGAFSHGIDGSRAETPARA